MKTINFLQHYFTSSKYKGGFFTLENSEGLSREAIAELERKGLYTPAVGLPSSPAEEIIKERFPINISFYRLKSSGNFVFLNSVYTGRTNHTVSRFGNFFSHSLILSEGAPLFPAKLFFDKIEFKQSFTLEEDLAYSPSLYEDKKVIFEDIESRVEDAFYSLQKFILEDRKRLRTFQKVFDLIVEGKIARSGYNITIQDRKENLKDLILSINYFLPLNLANEVPFATYVDNPESVNYPFKITGVIRECNISRLPEQYFSFVDAEKVEDYLPVHSYTKLLTEILEDGNYDKWKNFLEYIDLFSLKELNGELNGPAAILLFRNNFPKENPSNLIALISKVPKDRGNELKKFVLMNNPEFFLDYNILELEIAKDRRGSFSQKCDLFKQLYCENFVELNHPDIELLSLFVSSFLDLFSGLEKSKAALHVLFTVDEKKLKNIEDILMKSDYFFDESMPDLLDKLETFKKMPVVCLPFISDKTTNIYRYMKYDELIQLSKTEELYQNWRSYIPYIEPLREREKTSLIISCFNRTLIKKANYEAMFPQMTQMVKELFLGRQDEFWKKFFGENESYNKERDFSFSSLEYLKKKFTSYAFINTEHPSELIGKMKFDEESIKWILEDITEHTLDKGVVDKFKQVFRSHLGSSWGLFRH